MDIFLIIWGWFCTFFFYSLVFLEYISPFNVWYKTGLVVHNSLNLCLSEKLFISPSILNEIKGASWVQSYSVVQCLRHLMGQPLHCSAVSAGVWGERGYGDGSTPPKWLSSIALHPWLPGSPPQAFSTTVPSICLCTVNSNPHPGIAPQSLTSSS